MSLGEVIFIACVEGVTEFLPISSTGHMILAQRLLGVESSQFFKMFIVNIQFGAILSVLFLYWRRFFQSFVFYKKLFVAFLPAVFIGLLAGDLVEAMLGSVTVVAYALLAGGVILLFVDRIFKNPREDEEITYRQALIIGLFQCLAMIPGVSRSAASIVGGMSQGLNRKAAAEFSFFLAVPTMFAASVYQLAKNQDILTWDNFPELLLGNLVALVVAMGVIKFFIGYLARYGFFLFGIYRILVGLIILVLLALGHDLKVV
jgi:undecaprenyl-diphosphatase